MIDTNKFTEILKGIWYENDTGFPWTTRKSFRKMAHNGLGYYIVRKKCWHRLVWEHFNGKIPKGYVIDHKDNNPQNNVIDNLSLLENNKINCQKCKMRKNNTSGFQGIYYRKDTHRYTSHISVEGIKVNLGCFDTADEAYEAYLLAKIKYHGAESIAPLQRKGQ